jgi:ABC-type uncharacterized transport system ATPase subunit
MFAKEGADVKLELRGISKRFGQVVANDSITLTVEPGEIHALLGENGAGKSTLMNILYGLYQADEGQILIADQPVSFSDPGDAIEAGIGMVHQHFMLVPVFTVAENVVLGNEPTGFAGQIDKATAHDIVRSISERFGFDVNPDDRIENLPVGTQQRVEIIKALARDAKVLILDEPTAVLTPQETDELMTIMRELAASGTSIVFITHKLREVKAVADRITVIRQGRVVGEAPPDAPTSELASMMVGREVILTVDKNPAQPGDTILVADDLHATGSLGQKALDGVSFAVKAGEIVAVAGVQGNGQSELVEALIGLRPLEAGAVQIGGIDVTGRPVKEILSYGVGYVPEDRRKDGLVGPFTIEENLMLDRFTEAPFAKRFSLDLAGRREFSQQAIADFDIRTPHSAVHAAKLSGGNQQKVVLARELTKPLKLLIASQPTRGVDVGSIEFIHRRLIDARDAGVAVMIVSTELDEVFALADRIVVMYRGRVVADVTPDISRDRLGELMAGVVTV